MSAKNIQALEEIISQNGLRMTAARLTTFKLLASPEPQSIQHIITRAQGKVDRVSIYRNIELFEKLGIVHRIYIGWKYKLELSDEFLAHHHHLSCLTCGKMIDIEDEKHIDAFIKAVAEKCNFQPRRHQFEIDGYCSDCLQAQR